MMTNEDAIRKALACLRLAQSDNPNESALAAARAQEIIDRYKLDLSGIDLNGDSKMQEAFDNEPINDYGYNDPLDKQRDLQPWMLRLASFVARGNGCRIVWCRSEGSNGGTIKIIGRASDVATARYMHGFLKAEVIRLRNANCDAGRSGSYKRQFCLGVTDTIWDKLAERKAGMHAEIRAEAANNSQALMRVNNAIAKMEKRDEALMAYMKANFDLKGKSRIGSTTDSSARAHGQLAGREVRLGQARGGLTAGHKSISG